jgi:metal-sulfur cluster biosynthetic enzyme
MKQKIDHVLDRVKEPETGLSMAQLGLVERIRYHQDKKKLTVISCNLQHNHHYCCTVLQGLLIANTKNKKYAFPR